MNAAHLCVGVLLYMTLCFGFCCVGVCVLVCVSLHATLPDHNNGIHQLFAKPAVGSNLHPSHV